MQYWLNAFSKNYANFSGRARRAEYWQFALFQIIVFVVLAVLMRVSTAFLYVYVLYALASLIPSLALVVRRLHDVGKSGWFYFIALIPLVGGIWLLVLFCTAGNPGTNQYGPDPKAGAVMA